MCPKGTVPPSPACIPDGKRFSKPGIFSGRILSPFPGRLPFPQDSTARCPLRFGTDLSQVITLELGINIRELAIQSHDGIFEGKICVYVKDTENLNALQDRVGSIKGIEKVKRVL